MWYCWISHGIFKAIVSITASDPAGSYPILAGENSKDAQTSIGAHEKSYCTGVVNNVCVFPTRVFYVTLLGPRTGTYLTCDNYRRSPASNYQTLSKKMKTLKFYVTKVKLQRYISYVTCVNKGRF